MGNSHVHARHERRVIVFRYVKEFRAGFVKSSLPDRVILVWRYESQSGLPATAEREAMDRLEDLLAPAVEKPGFAMLALVSTGENLREWIYYAKTEKEFLQALNRALALQPRVPVEVHAAPPHADHFTSGIESKGDFIVIQALGG